MKSTYGRYKKIGNRRGISGAQAATQILQHSGIHDVRVEEVRGFLSDHYDPTNKVLRLSPDNYSGTSLAARALALLPETGILSDDEVYGARKVLTATTLTYVAATIAAIWQLLYWLWALGIIGGSRD